MVRAMDTGAIEGATGKTWHQWLRFLERARARELSHAEIARRVAAQPGVTGWWAQAIAVAYEQHIGRRRPGQTTGGKYRVAVSRTIDGTPDAALRRWLAVAGRRRTFAKVPLDRAAATTRSATYRYWHCGLSDGSRVSVGVAPRGRGKAVIGVAHHNIKSAGDVERWRAFWKSLLSAV